MNSQSLTPLDAGSAQRTPAPEAGFLAFLDSVHAEDLGGHWLASCPTCGGDDCVTIYTLDDERQRRPIVRALCSTVDCSPFPDVDLGHIHAGDFFQVDFAGLELFNDVGRSTALLAVLRDEGYQVRWVEPSDTYYLWDGKRWHGEATEIIRRLAHLLGERIAEQGEELNRAKATTTDTARRKEYEAMAATLAAANNAVNSARNLDTAVKELRRLPGVAVGDGVFDGRDDLLGVANGVVDLRTGKLLENQPHLMVTQHIRTAYDPCAFAPRWTKLIAEALPTAEDGKWLQRWLGYSITGCVEEEKMALFYGDGRNGKGCITETMRSVFDAVAVEESFGTFMENRRGNRDANALAMLRHARAVMASEGEDNQVLAAASIKELTGGNEINAKVLFKDVFHYKPKYKLTLSTNHRPQVRDNSSALWARMMVLPFPNSFVGREDFDLKRRLREDEAEGVLAWVVRGSVDWFANKLGTTETITAETAAYRATTDTLGGFLKECTDITDDAPEVQYKRVYGRYRGWCVANKEDHPIRTRTFSQMLDNRPGVSVVPDVRGVKQVRGLLLLNDAAEYDFLDPISSGNRS